jgi:hypothetical protein
MAFTLDNFVRATLQADITAGATTVTVTKAAPPLRDPPDATVDAPGLLVLQDTPTSPTKIEVISYTSRSIVGTVVTLTGVTRGLEGSTASPWSAGTPTFQGITAGVIAQKLDASGTAAKATQLATARTIALGGLLGGEASFDGSGNVTITATMADGALSIAKTAGLQGSLDGKAAVSHTHTISNVSGLQAALDEKAPQANPLFTGTVRANGNVVWDAGNFNPSTKVSTGPGYSPGNDANNVNGNANSSGFWAFPGGSANVPLDGWSTVINAAPYGDGTRAFQIAYLWNYGEFWIRSIGGAWTQLHHDGNQPRIFVQSSDPGAGAQDGNLWVW